MFKEDRQLLDGGKVEAGKTYTFSPEEEQAFVDNEVAEYAPEGGKKKAPREGGE